MKQIGSQRRETLREAGYTLVKKGDDFAILQYGSDEKKELWMLNDHHAGYTVEIDGKGYEFVRDWTH